MQHNKLTRNLSLDQKKAHALRQLAKAKRSTLTDFNFGLIKSWLDVERISGYIVVDKTKLLTLDSLNEFFLQLQSQEEQSSPLNPRPITSTTITPPGLAGTDKSLPKEESKVVDNNTETGEDEFSVIESLRHNPLVTAFPFQERTAAEIVRRFIRDNAYSLALNAQVGCGKTFIFGAVIKELWRRKFPPLVDSFSLYPCCVITRASIVEQTERVLVDQFGLKLGSEVDVTNIDQLRSKFGERFIREKTVVRGGEAEIVYEWIEPAAPGLIVLDEAQSVKNIESSQSLIFQAFNELDGSKHRSLYSSATLLTRVIESKAFAVSTRLAW